MLHEVHSMLLNIQAQWMIAK